MIIARCFVGMSAGIVLLMGLLHLLLTFRGLSLSPRDRALWESMKKSSPNISPETTMWKAWVGFNASHSFGAIFFGLIYGYFSIFLSPILFNSLFLMAAGFLLLSAYLILAKIYWFKKPLLGILLALACYSTGLLTKGMG